MSSNHEATLNVQNYREYVNNISINDTINSQKQLFLSCSNTFRLYCKSGGSLRRFNNIKNFNLRPHFFKGIMNANKKHHIRSSSCYIVYISISQRNHFFY